MIKKHIGYILAKLGEFFLNLGNKCYDLADKWRHRV